MAKNMSHFPGPGDWYPLGYKSEQFGFHLDDDASGAYEAWEALQETTEPAGFKWVLPSDDKLTILPKTQQSEEILSKLYNM
jgi:hypothetical protein